MTEDSLANPVVVEKLREIARLHDEAFDHAMRLDGLHKSNEGAVEIGLINRFDGCRDTDPLTITSISVCSSVFGPIGMHVHFFETVDLALAAVRQWYEVEMVFADEDEPTEFGESFPVSEGTWPA